MIKEPVHPWKKLLLRTTGSIAVILIILLSLNFLLKWIVSSGPVQEKIKAGISNKIAGTVDFQKLEVSLFPHPKAVIRHASFLLPGKAKISIETVGISPRILPLFAGKVHIAHIQLYAPHASLILHEKERERTLPLSIEDIKKRLSLTLNRLASKTYDIDIYLEKGTIDISDTDRSLFSFQGIDGQIFLHPEKFSVNLACSSNLSKSITLGIRLNPADFKGLGTLRLEGVKPQFILRQLFPKSVRHLGESEGDAMFSFRVNGLKDIQTDIQSSFSDLTLLSNGKEILMGGIGINGGFALGEDSYQITLNKLKIEHPRLTLSGSLVFDKNAQNVSLAVSGRDIDVNSLRSVALTAAGQVTIVRQIFNYVRGGSVPFIMVRSRGASLKDLGKTENILITGTMQRGNIFIPGPKLDFREVNADCEISGGILEGKNVLAHLGNSEVGDGKVKVGLKGRDVPLHIDAFIKADLAETKKILRGVIKNEPFIKELDRIRTIEGKASGRVILGENTASLKPRVYISELSFTAEYQPLPFPIVVKEGQFSYDEEKLSVSDARADILDASATVSGTHRGYSGGRPTTELKVRGEIGPRFLAWIAELAGLPSQLSIKKPVWFEQAHVVLEEDSVLFEGKWKIREGPEISASVFKNSKGLAINNLLIRDTFSDAALSLDLQEKTIKFGFAGKLFSETLNKLIVQKELPAGKIAGDFRVEVKRGKPLLFNSRGKLRAENISFALKEAIPLTIEHLSMNSEGNRLGIESASLILDGNPFSFHGNLESTEKVVVIDMDVSTKRIVWEKIAETAKKIMKGEDKEKNKAWDLPVEGSVRLKSDSFSYGKYSWMPLNADIAITRNAVDIVTRSSLCGISFLGKLGATPGAFSVDLQLAGNNLKLEPALACFEVKDREILTGTFNLKIKLNGQGRKEDLLDSLRGEMDFSAKKGRIYREVFLLKIFDFLEITQLLKGVPQIRQEGLAYKSIKAKGVIKAANLDIKEWVIDSPSLKIVAQGSLDLKKENMDFGVLVCPFKRIDLIIGKIPVIGGILGKNLLSIPLELKGDLSAPKVSFSPVSAVESGLLGILKRTIQAPVKLFDPLLHRGKEK